MGKLIIPIVVVVIFLVRVAVYFYYKNSDKGKNKKPARVDSTKTSPDSEWKKQLLTVAIFTKLSTKRFFRDRTAQFFSILFPLIFLFVFGSLSKGGNNVSFNVALINQSNTPFSRSLVKQLENSKLYKVNKTINTLSLAENKMDKSQIDGIIVLPPNFGKIESGAKYPTGQVKVIYNETTSGTGETLTTVLQANIKSLNSQFIKVQQPLSVKGSELNQKGLTAFDYTFSGLLGFSIIGLGIFGPVNVFPELKKQGILRRLHTTPLRTWQYFLATMFGQAITGIIAIIIQFIIAIKVFNLHVDGSYFYILIFTIISIFMILGLGLAIGGWAKNERQAAPLSNIVVFPMLFLSGTFFPRYVMPDWLQTITNYLPLTPVIDGLRMLTTEGKNLFQIGPQLGLIAIWFIVIYAIAFRVFKWE
jgi:ABC-2 type transport system permease protein